MTSKRGLTIVELLIATALLGLLITVVVAPLTDLFQMTGRSTRTLSGTTRAQETIEDIQGQWRAYPAVRDPLNPTPQETRNEAAYRRSKARYARTCLADFPAAPEGLEVEVRVWELGRNADAGAELSVKRGQTCGGGPLPDPPPMKRVTVTVTADNDGDAETVSLTVDIPRP